MTKVIKNNVIKDKKVVHAILQCILATALAILSLSLALVIDPTTARGTPALFFLPGIALSAWIGGYRTGFITSIISGLMLNYCFISPYFELKTAIPGPVFQTVLFIAEGMLISVFIDSGKRKDYLTDYKKHEKLLKAEIVELQKQVAITQNEIRQRDEFLSIASHELKTPLTSMLLQTQTALHNIRNVSLAQFSITHLLTMLESLENQTKRLSKMINDLLNVSILATGNLQIEREEVDLEQIASDVLDDFSERLDKEGYKTIFSVRERVVGNWDKVRIEQAVSNLISNAIKYGNHNPIEIQVRKKGRMGQFIIKDGGMGISKEQQDRIFNLFERAVSPEKYKGLGVGLYITHQIVKAHGGTIGVSSKPNRGTTFTILLPLQLDKLKDTSAQ